MWRFPDQLYHRINSLFLGKDVIISNAAIAIITALRIALHTIEWPKSQRMLEMLN